MAVTGVFSADFGSFFDAVEKSEIKLKDLETGANKVGDNLSRMANSFSGQKIIQDAGLMAKVFEDAGGAAAFTDKELARMGATANEAIEKLQALGKDVPPGIQKIADETKNATKETDSWTGSIGKLALGFVSLQTLKAAWNFAVDIAETAGALVDLSEQTRISVEDLQIMASAMSEFGVDADQLGRALFKLSNNIANKDDGVADALLNMGLAIEHVKGLRGEELFLTIQNGLAKLDGSLRDTTAVTLYGEKLGMSMSGAAAGTQEAIDKTREHIKVITTEQAKALDTASESIGKMVTNLKAMAAGPLAEVATAFNKVHDAARGGAGVWATFVATMKDIGDSWDTGVNSAKNLNALLAEQKTAQQENTAETKKGAAAANENAAAQDNQAGATKRAREAAAGLKDFEAITRAHKENQDIVQRSIDQETAAANQRAENAAKEIRDLEAKKSAGLGWMNQVKDFVGEQAKATEVEKQFAIEQEQTLKNLQMQTAAYGEAGDAAASGGQQTVAAFQGISQQVELTSDGIRGWIELMKFTNRANAILNRNSLFTTSGQLEEIANIPSFAGGVESFAGGLAKVHGGETLVNLPAGTSVIPKGAGGGVTVQNTFNLVDTESNLARRVSETIMRTVRAGTQLGTA